MNLVAPVSAYAARFHRAVGSTHHVASPLGAWIVVALAAPAATSDRSRQRLAEALGMPLDEAAAAARTLLERQHPVVALAAAAWAAGDSPALRAWLDTLGADVERGPVPAQHEVDQWASRHTFGLIDEFPLDVTFAVLVLASAIATIVSWHRPFDVVEADRLTLPRAAGFATIERLLHDPGRHTRSVQAIVTTDAGLMAVHAARSRDDDLMVVSVIADLSVASDAVLEAAHPIAVAIANDDVVAGRTSLFDLPLGRAHAWTLDEQAGPDEDAERFQTTLPAWSATSRHDLMTLPELGFGQAGEALAALVGGGSPSAKQAALARYTRTGFEAAAVTAIAVPLAARASSRTARLRTARVEFTHPYAVVAVARDQPGTPTAWAGLPLSAWVTEADEAD